MRQQHAELLRDPLTGSSLTLTTFDSQDVHVWSGLLTSDTGWYPVVRGVPRLLVGPLLEDFLAEHRAEFEQLRDRLPEAARQAWEEAIHARRTKDGFVEHQVKTSESFSYEWDAIYRENNYERENFFHFVGPFITPEQVQGRRVVDIGCGSGRFTKQAALAGAEVSVGSDLGESVEVAFRLTRELPNVLIVQADVYAMPFRHQFDLAMSIGVLHHLPKPEGGFARLPDLLRANGRAVIWVYNRRNNARALYFYEPVRSVLKHMPKSVVLKLSYPPAAAVEVLNWVTRGFNLVGAKRLAKAVPFSYYANFPFNMKLNDAFDVLATPKSNYYFVEQIDEWYRHAALNDIQTFEHPEAGITAIGTYGG